MHGSSRGAGGGVCMVAVVVHMCGGDGVCMVEQSCAPRVVVDGSSFKFCNSPRPTVYQSLFNVHPPICL